MVRLRFLMSAVFSLIAAAIVSGYLAGAAAADAVVTNDVAKSARLHELTVDTDAFTEPTKLHVFLPTGYDDDPDRRWPVTYSLAGVQNNYDSFAKVLRGESLTADYPSIVVSPDGNSGWWSDWYNFGEGGAPKYETFVIDQLIPLIDARYRTEGDRAHRAIMGISMGGYGSMSLAARHPDLFGSAATMSGAVDSNLPLISASLSLTSTFDGGRINAVNGNWLTQAVRWHGKNPTDLASNLRGMDVQVRTANGNINTSIGEGDTIDDYVSCVVEAGVYQGSVSFNAKLDSLGVDHLWKDYGAGCHTRENFTRELLATMAVFEGNFANPAPDPATFDYKTIESDFDIWGWSIKADLRRAVEFMRVWGGENTLTLKGSGTTSVISPPIYGDYDLVNVNGVGVAPDADGRIHFNVNLGSPHWIQAYTLFAPSDYRTITVNIEPQT